MRWFESVGLAATVVTVLGACGTDMARTTPPGERDGAAPASDPTASPPPPTTPPSTPPTGADAGPTTGDDAASPPASDAASPPPGNPPPPVPPPPSSSLDPEIAAMVAHVDAARIEAAITALVGFGTRNACSDDTSKTRGIGAARDWIRAQLADVKGLQVVTQSYAQTKCASAVTRHNVVAWLPGARADRLVVVGGHYDSRTVDVADGTSDAPGANDSGSQTALVLEAARAMAGHAFDATVVFVAFAGEEQGLVGSAAFAKGYTTYFPGAKIEAMLNADIVGGDNTANDAAALTQVRVYSPGTPREINGGDGTTDDTSPSRGLMRFAATWGTAYVPSMSIVPKLREDRPGRGGDHESFIAAGVPGVRFIELNEATAHQHTADDKIAYVTPAYTARVTGLAVATLASLARAPMAPSPFTQVTRAGGAVTLAFTPPAGGAVDHYAVAARAVTSNAYGARVPLAKGVSQGTVSLTDLGVASDATFVSFAAVDAHGHESLFAYPEWRCDAKGCAIPPSAGDVTATR